MGFLRPGGEALTEYALKAAGAKPGMRLLDEGCGDGSAALIASERFGLNVSAIDTDKNAVEAAKKKGIDASVCDASMLEFDIHEFDIVIMECSFSAFERQEESFHEAYCVLKEGGCIVMTDVYCRNPDLERWERDYWSAMSLWRRPRVHEECHVEKHLPSPYTQDGALVLKGIYDLAEELEMEVELFEDRTKDLTDFAAQAIMDHGSVENWFRAEGTWNPGCEYGRNTGYFLMIIRKPVRNA